MIRHCVCWISVIMVFLASQNALAMDIFVNNSTELANACTGASSGDVINISAGTYTGPFVLDGKDNITLRSYNGAAYLQGSPSADSNGIIILQIINSSSITINGLVFRNNWGNFADGINVSGSGDGISIANCEFYDIGWTTDKVTFPNAGQNAHALVVVGSSATSISNVFIGGNYIHDCITGYSESLTVVGNVEYFLIEGNTLTSNTNIGIDAAGHFSWTGAPPEVNYARSGIIRENIVSDYAGPAELDAAGGIYIDGGSYITVENNRVYNYKVGFSVGCEVPGNSNTGNILRNNLAYNCGLSGLFLGSNTTSMVYNTGVYNNTFFKCGFGTFDNGQIALQNNSGSIIKNNIMYPTNGRTAMVQMGGTSSLGKIQGYNLYWRDNGDTNNLFYNVFGDTNAVLADPKFVDANTADFHIAGISPAANAGDPAYDGAGQEDLDGDARTQGGRVDIGVDETDADSVCTPTTIVPYVKVNNGEWQQTESVTIIAGDSVTFAPEPISGGSWSWSGCDASGSSREQTITLTSTCYPIVTYTNSCGTQSSMTFNITVVEGVDIVIDGNNEDWGSIPSIAAGGTGGLDILKVADNNEYLYILVSGTILSHYEIFIDTDNSTNAGGNDYVFTDWPATGFDFMVEDGELYAHVGQGAGWSWTYLESLMASKNTDVIEVAIPKSQLGVLASTINIGVKSINARWKPKGYIPNAGDDAASYVLGSTRGRLAVIHEPSAGQEGENLLVYPNPSGGLFSVRYQVEEDSWVDMSLFDMYGRKVALLKHDYHQAGGYQLVSSLDEKLSEGTYVIRMVYEGGVDTKLIKVRGQ